MSDPADAAMEALGLEVIRLRKIATRMRDALVDIRDELDGSIDINDNGGPNWAGRIVNTIDLALGEAWPCGPKDSL